MGRMVLKGVLILGVVVGLASGCASLHRHGHLHGPWHHGGYHHGDRATQFEAHVADICARAAIDATSGKEKTDR